MPLPIDELRAQYQLIGRTIDSSLKRMGSKSANHEEEHLILQGTYLFGVRSFEYFLEQQLIHLCHPGTVWGPKVVAGKTRSFVRKLGDSNPNRIKAILTMGASYADYLPIDRTQQKASVLFARGRPFSLLQGNHKEIIKRAHTVRNLIAHESEHAMKQFTKVVCSRYPLPPEKRNASGYLLYEAIKGTPMAKQDLAGLFDAAAFLS